MKEIWKKINNFPEYSASNLGRFRRNIPGKYAWSKDTSPTFGKLKDGYRRISLIRDGQRVVRKSAHQLILETFVGPRPKGQEARHLNDIRSDNRVENLAWGTHKENYEDMKKNGRGRGWWDKTPEEKRLSVRNWRRSIRENNSRMGYGHLSKKIRIKINKKMVKTKAMKKKLGLYSIPQLTMDAK